VLVTEQWLDHQRAKFAPERGTFGAAHLTNYTVEYNVYGSGEPIVLVPGLAGGMGLLGPLAQLLARDHKVITYQLRGEDNCFAVRRPFHLNDLVYDLREFLDVLGVESPTLFGVSFGGAIALEFAARYPGRIGNLIVQGAGSRFQPGLLQQIAGAVLNRFPLPFDSPFVNQFLNLLFGRPEHAGPLLDFVTQQIWSTDQSMMAHRLHLIESFNMCPKLASVRVPSLVLSGAKDVLVPERNLRELCKGLPNGEHIRLPAAGHLAFVTHADMVAKHVREFLSV
jgi:pimeloyl-ACP methyl ester carboxylesterase